MLYTNQKTFRNLQVTLDLLTSTRDQIYFGDTTQYHRDTNDTVIPASTALSNSCKTHSEAVSLKYTIEYTNINTLEIIQALCYLQNVGARFWDIPPLPPKCEIFPLLCLMCG